MSPSHSSSPAPFSVAIRNVTVSRADRPVLVDVTLTASERTRAAVVGPNGIGKSTLLRVMAGRLAPDSGSVERSPRGVTVGLLDQELNAGQKGGQLGGQLGGQMDDASTVRDLVALRLGVRAAEVELSLASQALADGGSASVGLEGGDRYERALERFLALGAADLDSRLEKMAEELGLAPHLLQAAPATLSGGEAERVGLAMVMLSRFDLTLLDEPTNNLDLEGLDRLERWVADHQGGLIMVSHDRTFLERAVSTVIEIDHHRHTVSEFNGGWEAYVQERATAAALAQERFSDYVTERDRLAERSQQQREWAAKGASRARRHPADGDKFRRNHQLAQTEKLVGKAKATRKAMERLEVVEKPWQPWDLRFSIDRAPRSATIVAAFDGALLGRGSFTLGPVNLEIRWAERVAIVGPNGSGKSTLLAAMLGRLAPISGRVKLGPGVKVGEIDQRRDGFGAGPASPLVSAFQDASGLSIDEARSVLAKFGLDSEAVSRPASSLSPGERTRAQLALFQATGVNLLVLDEPTNHLDMPAIEQLEAALARFDGTLILVTHDRRLLETVALSRTIDLSQPRDLGLR